MGRETESDERNKRLRGEEVEGRETRRRRARREERQEGKTENINSHGGIQE